MTHTSVRKGKRVVVHMKDGSKIFGKFNDNVGRYIILADGTKIPTHLVRTLSIAKGVT